MYFISTLFPNISLPAECWLAVRENFKLSNRHASKSPLRGHVDRVKVRSAIGFLALNRPGSPNLAAVSISAAARLAAMFTAIRMPCRAIAASSTFAATSHPLTSPPLIVHFHKKGITLCQIVFCLIVMKARIRAAPSRVPRNETIVSSDSSPSCGAGVFFPTIGTPSRK
jgi:hypothetical protein